MRGHTFCAALQEMMRLIARLSAGIQKEHQERICQADQHASGICHDIEGGQAGVHKPGKQNSSEAYQIGESYSRLSTTGTVLTFHATIQAGSASRTTVVSTQSSNAVLQNITTIFGSKASDALRPLQAEAGESMHITGYANALHSAWNRPQGCLEPQAGLL